MVLAITNKEEIFSKVLELIADLTEVTPDNVKYSCPIAQIGLDPIIFSNNLSNKIFSPTRHQDTKFSYSKQLLFVSLWLFYAVYSGWVEAQIT